MADGTQTLLCTYMSAALLAGLILNATLGWAWADPLAGLAIAGLAVREGIRAWRGEGCACTPSTIQEGTAATAGAGHTSCCDGCGTTAE